MIIAQLSDIHTAPDNDHLARFDNALAWLKPFEPDVLVISGDLIDDGWREGYAAIAARLETLSCRTMILPGNSDDRTAMRAVWPSLAQQGPLNAVIDTPALRMIGLDSTVEGSAAGSVGAHLDWLARQLDEAGGRQTLLFLHHHVFVSGIPSMDAAACRDAQALGKTARDCHRARSPPGGGNAGRYSGVHLRFGLPGEPVMAGRRARA